MADAVRGRAEPVPAGGALRRPGGGAGGVVFRGVRQDARQPSRPRRTRAATSCPGGSALFVLEQNRNSGVHGLWTRSCDEAARALAAREPRRPSSLRLL